MVTQLRHGLLIVGLIPALTGCEPFQDCTAEMVWAISVEMRPGFAEPPARKEAFGVVRDGSYLDSLRVFYWTEAGDSVDKVFLHAAGQRDGIYDVTVRRSGFQTWDTTGVRVRDDGCHPITAELRVTLRRAP